MRKVLITVFLMLLLAASPTASAWWGGKGAREPDTTWDETAGYATLEPDWTPIVPTTAFSSQPHQVYFNGFEGTMQVVTTTTFSPNLATVGTAHRMTSHINYAMLGVWKDCNHDRFVGLGDHGLWEYRRELLTATFGESICPVQAPPAGAANPFNVNWQKGQTHNDGVWIHEFIPIGYDDQTRCRTCLDQDIMDYNDTGARVWVDGGQPNAPGPFFTCFIRPQPEGTYHSVAGMVDNTDCYTRHRLNPAIWTVTRTTGQQSLWNNTVRPTRNPWGDSYEPSYADVWDCSQPQVAHVIVTTTIGVGVSHPRAPPNVRTTGTISGTLNETMTGTDDCNKSDNVQRSPQGEVRVTEDEEQVAMAPYALEDDAVSDQSGLRARTDTLFFTEGHRPTLAPIGSTPLGTYTSEDLGAGQYNPNYFWSAGTQAVFDNAFVDILGPRVSGPVYATFFAYVSSPGMTTSHGLVLPVPKTYGAEACGSTAGTVGAPPLNNWYCDPTKWWKTTTSTGQTFDSTPREVLLGTDPDGLGGVKVGASPGKPYLFRDVDCYDEGVKLTRENGVGTWIIANAQKTVLPDDPGAANCVFANGIHS